MSDSEASRRHPNVINLNEVTPHEISKGTRFGATIKQLGVGTDSPIDYYDGEATDQSATQDAESRSR